MTASSPPTPRISITISVDPKSYSFTDPHPPTLSITLLLLSHASSPVTFFTFFSPLNPESGLAQECFPITDLSTSPPSPVPQSSIRLQRLPFSRARGSGDDQYFLTLYPETPLKLSAGFATGGGEGWRRPQPKHVVEKGWVVDERGNPTNARRGIKGIGVDGLESGKRYRVDVNSVKLRTVWWKWGERDEIMVDEGDWGWNLSELEKGEGDAEWDVGEGVEFEIL